MNKSNRKGLIAALVVAVVVFLIFGYGTMGSFVGHGMMDSGRMMDDGRMRRAGFGGYGWMLIPTLITLGIGVWLGWMLFAKKK